MDKKLDKQINEFNHLCHYIVMSSDYKNLEDKYTLLKSLDENEISIIRIVSQEDEVIIREIGNILKVPKSTLTSIIDRLEKKDFIIRTISKKDRRSYKLELTDKGKKAQEEHEKFEYEFYGKIIKSLNTFEEREEFIRLIKQIASNITKL